MRGLGRFYQLHVSCAGHADPTTGYFISIKHIDKAVAQHAVPYLDQLINTTAVTAAVPMGRLMATLIDRLGPPLDHTVAAVQLDLAPYYWLTIESNDMQHVTIHQHYEFSASHRLHVPAMGDDDNRSVFGKCNNPSGHGHNYQIKVAVRAPIDPRGHATPVERIDALIDEAVLQKLDHKHLNVDVPQFADLNPTVENIAQVIYGMIQPRIGELGVELRDVSVWETGKTVCVYSGDKT